MKRARFFNLSGLILNRFRYALGAVAVIILALGYLFFIGPQIQTIREFGLVDLNEEQKKVQERKTYLEQLRQMVANYQTINQQRLTDFAKLLPDEADLPGLFVGLEDLVTKSELKLTSLSITPATLGATATTTGSSQSAANPMLAPSTIKSGTSELKGLNISLLVTGAQSYESIKSFLERIEGSLRLMNIQSVAFTPPQTEAGGAAPIADTGSSININLQTFYLTSTGST